jgi:hypothetical protein
MKVFAFAVILFFVTLPVIGDDASFADCHFQAKPQVLVDPKTKITFYLESDRRHVSAIAPNGKLLWRTEFVMAQKIVHDGSRERVGILCIMLMDPKDGAEGPGKADEFLKVVVVGYGFGGETDYIEKKTGKIHPGDVT